MIHKSSEKVVMLDMTDERKAKYMRISCEIIALLKREVPPYEAYAILQMLLNALTEEYGIEESMMLTQQTEMKQ